MKGYRRRFGFSIFKIGYMEKFLSEDFVQPLLSGRALSYQLACCHFTGFLKKVHCTPKHLKTLRMEMAAKVFPGVPFFQEKELIFILHAPPNIAPPAPLLSPYRIDQQCDRLGKFLVLFRNDRHFYDHQGHEHSLCDYPAKSR